MECGQSWEAGARKWQVRIWYLVHHSIGQMCIWYLSLTWQRPLSLWTHETPPRGSQQQKKDRRWRPKKPQSGKIKAAVSRAASVWRARCQMSQPLSLALTLSPQPCSPSHNEPCPVDKQVKGHETGNDLPWSSSQRS